ncbi:unnamed protein product, partial [Symbiodinium natans]
MILHNGAAYLRLEPASPAPAAPAPPAAAPEEPVAACAVRPVPDLDDNKPPTHADIQRNIDSGAIMVHVSRVAQTASAHRSLVTNIQKALRLPVGISNGEWGVEAQRRLFEVLRKAKRSRGRVLAIADKEEAPRPLEQLPFILTSDSSTSENRKSNTKQKTDMNPLEEFECFSVAYDEAVAANKELRQDIYMKDLRISELEEAMSNLLDEAMEQFGGKEHHCESLSLPRCGFVDASALEHPVSIKDFITNVCQRPEGLKTCPLTFDVHWNIPGFGNVARLGEVIQSNHLDDLPDAVRLKKQLPPTSKEGLCVDPHPDQARFRVSHGGLARIQGTAWASSTILDDPQVDNLPMADIKSWLTLEEDQNWTGRYNDVKMDDNSRRCITSDEFFELARKFSEGHQETDVLATLKRVNRKERSSIPSWPSVVSSASSQSAVRKTEWQPIGRKYLEGRNIIFHTDSARSYKTRLNKVVHDNVVRCKKKVRVNGKWTWQMPKYVKVTTHTLPGTNKKVKAKAGTQIVDRAWRYIKDRLSLNQSTRPGSRLIRASTDPGSSANPNLADSDGQAPLHQAAELGQLDCLNLLLLCGAQ